MNDPGLHIMVVVEPGHGGGLDWPRTRRDAGERGATVSLLEASASGATWLVPAGPAASAASQVTLPPVGAPAVPGAGAAVIDKLFEVQAHVTDVTVTEVRLYAGTHLESDLVTSLEGQSDVRLRVFDAGALRAGRVMDDSLLVPVGPGTRGKVFRPSGGTPGREDFGPEWRPAVTARPSGPDDPEPVRILATGLKSIDLLAPFVVGGHHGVLGPERSGRLVAMEELLLRLGVRDGAWPLLAAAAGRTPEGWDILEEAAEKGLTDYFSFVLGEEAAGPDGALRVASSALTMAEYQRDEERRSTILCLSDVFSIPPGARWLDAPPSLTSWPWGRGRMRDAAAITFLYVAGVAAGDAGTDTRLRELDAVVVLSREIAARGLYPAVDPLTSTSRALAPEIVGAEHYRVAQEVTALLRREAEILREVDDPGRAMLDPEDRTLLDRAAKVRQFLSQNTYLATRYTGVEGSSVPIRDTVEGFAAILSGALDHIEELAFFNMGPLADVEERWEGIQRERQT